MATPMEAIKTSVRDEVFLAVMQTAIDSFTEQLGLSSITAMSLLANLLGTNAACIDRMMQENDEVRIRLCEPHMDHLVAEYDTKELVEVNFKLGYDMHVKVHEKRVAQGKQSTQEAIDKLCESHKRGLK